MEKLSKSAKQRADYVYSRLKREYGHIGAVALLGNFHTETGGTFDPGQKEIGKGRKGKGLAQYTYPSRVKALMDFTRRAGKPWNDLEAQVNYIIHEINQDYPGVRKVLKNSKNINDATLFVSKKFESPNPLTTHNDRRVDAENSLDKMYRGFDESTLKFPDSFSEQSNVRNEPLTDEDGYGFESKLNTAVGMPVQMPSSTGNPNIIYNPPVRGAINDG